MNIIKYLFYVMISCILLVALCFIKDPNGNFRVHNRLRLLPLTSSFPSQTNGVIRVTTQQGEVAVSLVWHSFKIDEGSITFSGHNGKVCVGKDDVFIADFNDFGCFTGKFNTNAVFQLRTQDKTDESQSLLLSPYIPNFYISLDKKCIDSSGYAPDEFWKKFHLFLYSVESNGWIYIEIPYSTSDDFRGEIGKLTLESNVYEY